MSEILPYELGVPYKALYTPYTLPCTPFAYIATLLYAAQCPPHPMICTVPCEHKTHVLKRTPLVYPTSLENFDEADEQNKASPNRG
jgi:hypothetical protein